MQQASVARRSETVIPSLASKVRDTLVLNENLLVELVNEILTAQPAHAAEFFRRKLKAEPAFGVSIKRVVVDLGVVLTLAKSLETDDEFSDSAGLIHDIDYSAHEGSVGAFARAMVLCDMQAIGKAEGEDAIFYDLIPADTLKRRLQLILAFMDQKTRRN